MPTNRQKFAFGIVFENSFLKQTNEHFFPREIHRKSLRMDLDGLKKFEVNCEAKETSFVVAVVVLIAITGSHCAKN